MSGSVIATTNNPIAVLLCLARYANPDPDDYGHEDYPDEPPVRIRFGDIGSANPEANTVQTGVQGR